MDYEGNFTKSKNNIKSNSIISKEDLEKIKSKISNQNKTFHSLNKESFNMYLIQSDHNISNIMENSFNPDINNEIENSLLFDKTQRYY